MGSFWPASVAIAIVCSVIGCDRIEGAPPSTGRALKVDANQFSMKTLSKLSTSQVAQQVLSDSFRRFEDIELIKSPYVADAGALTGIRFFTKPQRTIYEKICEVTIAYASLAPAADRSPSTPTADVRLEVTAVSWRNEYYIVTEPGGVCRSVPSELIVARDAMEVSVADQILKEIVTTREYARYAGYRLKAVDSYSCHGDPVNLRRCYSIVAVSSENDQRRSVLHMSIGMGDFDVSAVRIKDIAWMKLDNRIETVEKR